MKPISSQPKLISTIEKINDYLNKDAEEMLMLVCARTQRTKEWLIKSISISWQCIKKLNSELKKHQNFTTVFITRSKYS